METQDQFVALIEELEEMLKGAAAVSAGSLPFVDVDRVTSLMRTFASSAPAQEWSPFLNWSASHYTRNLVYTCEDFELIVICWGAGQVSRGRFVGHSSCGRACDRASKPLPDSLFSHLEHRHIFLHS